MDALRRWNWPDSGLRLEGGCIAGLHPCSIPGGWRPSSTEDKLPTKRAFDLTLLVIILAHPAFGLLRMASRRWSKESNEGSALETLGDAVQVAL